MKSVWHEVTLIETSSAPAFCQDQAGNAGQHSV